MPTPLPIPPEARVGYCCLFRPPLPDPKEVARFNVTGTTVAALSRMERVDAYEKMLALVSRNMHALDAHIRRVATASPIERMLRLDSGVLPAYTHPVARWMYDEPDLRRMVEDGLAHAGDLARRGGVRVSLHPGPFCVIGSQNPAALKNGVEDFEYHTDLMRWMGFAGGWHPQGAHINIHVGSTATGVEGFRAGLNLLSEDARNLITVENDEISFDLDSVLALADALPIVFDLHHEWISSGGTYVQTDDPRIPQVVASWRGVRPVAHISVSREDVLPDHDPAALPEFQALLAAGFKVRDLRAHSEFMWNDAVNDWAASHLAWADLEVEAKQKNLASHQLAEHARQRRLRDPAGLTTGPAEQERRQAA